MLFALMKMVRDKPCLDNSAGKTENSLERGFVKHRLNSV